MGRKRSLDFEDSDEEETSSTTAAPAAETEELGTSKEARQAVAAQRISAPVSEQPKRKRTKLDNAQSGFVPEVVENFVMPEKAKRNGKWSQLADSLGVGEAVVNLVNRQQATSLRQALKTKGKLATMAQLQNGNFAVKVLKDS